jgi:hypothetical protein
VSLDGSPECYNLYFMGKSHFKKAISSLESRIAEHKEKIRLQLEKDFPDPGLINHWEKEIKAFEQGIKQALKRLGKN